MIALMLRQRPDALVVATLSTFDTDGILVPVVDRQRSTDVLDAAEHTVRDEEAAWV